MADPKNFEGVVTRTVTINKAGKAHEIEVVKGKTILEAGLDAAIDLSYSCQTGSCLLCRGVLLSGELKSINSNSILKLKGNEHLLCCSLPLTNNVEVSID